MKTLLFIQLFSLKTVPSEKGAVNNCSILLFFFYFCIAPCIKLTWEETDIILTGLGGDAKIPEKLSAQLFMFLMVHVH